MDEEKDYDSDYDPIEEREECENYRQDAALDAFFDKHPPQTLTLRLQMDLVQGLWLEHVIKVEGDCETVDDIDASRDVDEFLGRLKTWLTAKWERYQKSQEGMGRRFPSMKHSQLKVERGLIEYQDGHVECKGFSEFSREGSVSRVMLQMFGDDNK